ncbi:glycoside hydrolase family 25 protein [Rummeliibacillus stabekisii]|uniref:glycoside hydrolase family 25 protein n=1 Tax=Rummeliibacillus stabekisii TaxID=241244 RepID=UPI003710FE41
MVIIAGAIVDISHHQGTINWSKFSKAVDMVIIRTQDGSSVEDTMHTYNEQQAIKYKVPFGVYAFNRASSAAAARIEAKNFYQRANKNTKFYVIDVETFSSSGSIGGSGESMRSVINAYVAQLRALTKKKIGLYIANHLYDDLHLDVTKFDFVWIPRYGVTPPSHPFDMWQYTETGTVEGVSGKVDLNRLAGKKTLAWYIGDDPKKEEGTENIKKGELTITQYEELKKRIEELEKALGKKDSKVSEVHKEGWAWAKKEGIMDGQNPKKFVSREMLSSVLFKKFNKKK